MPESRPVSGKTIWTRKGDVTQGNDRFKKKRGYEKNQHLTERGKNNKVGGGGENSAVQMAGWVMRGKGKERMAITE